MNCTRPNERSSASRERRDEQRLREPGHADEQRVAAREQRDEHEVDDLLLPDHDASDLLLQAVTGGGAALEQGDGVVRSGLEIANRHADP